jgi:hypothetical protein
MALCTLSATAEGRDTPRLLLWTTGPLVETDPETPATALDALLAQPVEAG